MTVTDPLGQETLYEIEREEASGKPRLARISGDCPSCGLSPNSQLFYEDAAEPLRPTRQMDGKGHVTLTTYTAHGQPATRTEAAGTAEERTTTWEYDAIFPVFVTREERPSTSGGGASRVSEAVYDAEGNASPRTISGAEAGAAFSLATASLWNAAGQPLSIDPPGHGTADATSFTYDPARGNLLPLTRTDPIVGATIYGYDPLNRRTSVTDPNGVITTTAYDPLDRTTQMIQKGATPAEDLVTTHVYDAFGDLDHTVMPRGNVIDYGYDDAGRIIWVERKPDLSTPGERTFHTLDAYGHRVEGRAPALDRKRLGDPRRDRLRLLHPLPPGQDDLPGRHGDRVRLRLQRQPRAALGRRPSARVFFSYPELFLRRPRPAHRRDPAVGRRRRRRGSHHVRLRCPGPPHPRHRRRGRRHDLPLLGPRPDDAAGLRGLGHD